MASATAKKSLQRGVDNGEYSIEKSPTQRFFESASPYIIAALVGAGAADLSVMSVRDSMVPQKPPAMKPAHVESLNPPPKSSYQIILSRNILSPEGLIADALSAKGDNKGPGNDLPPVPSQLPLNLVGTVVFSNPAKGLANIEVKAKSTVLAVPVGHNIDTLATLVKVERNKAIFRNLNNGRLEYIENKPTSTTKITLGATTEAPSIARGTGEVKMVAPNKFKLSRTAIMKHTQDLSKLLMQASTVPRKKANGDIECYVLTSFQPDSVFADLGVQQGDCIKSVNGEPIDSPAKAMELYNALKNANTIKITVESDGHDVEKEYNIE